MPTARSRLSGVAIALFIALRIQAGLAANIRPSSTNRMPTPMRKSANAMDLIGLQPPVGRSFLVLAEAKRNSLRLRIASTGARYGFGTAATGGLPEELLKNLKKSESGRSRNRVS